MSENPTPSLGRQLLSAPPVGRVAVHQNAWPKVLEQYQQVVGQVLSRVLAGEQAVSITRDTEELRQI